MNTCVATTLLNRTLVSLRTPGGPHDPTPSLPTRNHHHLQFCAHHSFRCLSSHYPIRGCTLTLRQCSVMIN